MLKILGSDSRFCDGMNRRGFLQVGSLGMGGLALPDLLRAEAANGSSDPRKAVIMILLPGGPSHIDMYDLKPDAPSNIRGEFKPIPTAVPGIEICELMPRMAALMDKLVVIRSLEGARNDHNIHQCVTGWESHPAMFTSPNIPGYPAGGWPSIGSVVSKLHGTAVPGVPPSVDLRPVYYDARFATSADPGQAGYLGSAHSAFQVEAVDRSNIVLNGIGLDRLRDRRRMLTSFDRFRRQVDLSGVMESVDEFTQQAFSLMTSPKLAQALDLEREHPRVRSRYGLNGTAERVHGGGGMLDQFLIARRMVEAGARCVTLVFSRWPFGRMMKGDFNWDWHKDNFAEARATLPLFDQGISALIEDLDQRDMLDDVSVVSWGEFGRTPKINGNAGRDHWPGASAALMAGGGIRSGQVIGSTNRYAERPKDRPVHFREVFATLYHSLGIDIERTQLRDLAGRPHFLVDNRKPMPELV